MRLQVSLDRTNTDTALALLSKIAGLVDIVEVGTPFLLAEGVAAVRAIRAAYPAITILADTKIMDGGEYSAALAFDAGADIVTVCAVAGEETIRAVVKAARLRGKEVFVDLIAMKEPAERALLVDREGADYIGVHLATDAGAGERNTAQLLRDLRAVRLHARTAVAGGIDLETLPQVVRENPELVICGRAITESPDPYGVASEMHRIIANAGKQSTEGGTDR